MAKKFSALVASSMSPESITRAKTMAQQMREEMPLNELRQARGLSQKALAAVLSETSMIVKQGFISARQPGLKKPCL